MIIVWLQGCCFFYSHIDNISLIILTGNMLIFYIYHLRRKLSLGTAHQPWTSLKALPKGQTVGVWQFLYLSSFILTAQNFKMLLVCWYTRLWIMLDICEKWFVKTWFCLVNINKPSIKLTLLGESVVIPAIMYSYWPHSMSTVWLWETSLGFCKYYLDSNPRISVRCCSFELKFRKHLSLVIL